MPATFLIELRNAWYAIAARPAFSALVVGVLAIGLGCVLYVAGMVNGLVVRPLPYADAERLIYAGLIDNDDPLDTDDFDALTVDEFLEWRERLAGSAEVAGFAVATINLGGDERPERFPGGIVTANAWSVLGVAPVLGRGFTPADEVPGAAPVVILSDVVWRTRYLADPGIVGRVVRVNARDATVVGVMPPDFSFPYQEQVWLPAEMVRGEVDPTDLDAMIRPAPGVDAFRVQTVLEGWLADARRADPEGMGSRARDIGIRPFSYLFVDGDTRGLFGVMFAAVLLVLLTACANAANLMLTRIAGRQQEFATRVALGASRNRVVMHQLAYTLLLSLAALALALPLGQGLVQATVAMFAQSAEDGPPRWMRFDLDANLVLLAIAAALATALLAGLLPALRAAQVSAPQLHSGARTVSGGAFARASRALVVVEIALSCALLIAAFVLVQAIQRLDRFDLGLRTEGVLTARIALFGESYPDDESQRRYIDRLLQDLRADPGVAAASAGTSLPGLMGANTDVLAVGAPVPPEGLPNPGYSTVDERFLETMGGTLVAGRFFTEADDADSAPVIVVDQTFAERIAGGGEVLGKQYRVDALAADERTATVVGVIRPVQMEDIDDPREPAVFAPIRQDPFGFVSVFVRTRGEPMAFATRLREIVGAIDADTPAYWVRGYDEVLREATFGERVLLRVFGGFGIVALLLAIAGLYGVVAFSVEQRTREIGVRRALGAPDGRVLASVAGRSAGEIAAGLALGLAAGIPFAHLLAIQISEIVRVDTLTWLVVVIALGAASVLATCVPARRALRVDPMVALRHE
jgi:predicted permease